MNGCTHGPSNFEDVGEFHHKFGLHSVTHDGPGPTIYATNDVMQFRMDFMQEELDEFARAWEVRDDVQMFDALLDLVYVAMGTAHLLGYPWADGWREVQRTNMLKERANGDGGNSKRLSAFDVVKPEGWTPPELGVVLAERGF